MHKFIRSVQGRDDVAFWQDVLGDNLPDFQKSSLPPTPYHANIINFIIFVAHNRSPFA